MNLERRVSCQVMRRCFQFRDDDEAILDSLNELLGDIISAETKNGSCEVSLSLQGRSFPALMDDKLQNLIEQAAENAAPGQHMRMPSGAGHDARQFLKSCRRR